MFLNQLKEKFGLWLEKTMNTGLILTVVIVLVPGFYFGKLNGKTTCYHLDSAQFARAEHQVETIIFSDDEFSGFLSALISNL